MFGWDHQLNGHEFEENQGDSEGQITLVYCNSWGYRHRYELKME